MNVCVKQARLSPIAAGMQQGRSRHSTRVGRYRLISRLGAGGMGEVYLAEHRATKQRLAIKFIRREHAHDTRALARFEQEARYTARLCHDNIVKIVDRGRTADKTPYYVMEYLSGGTLEEILEQHGPIPAARVIHFLRQACYALRHAHEAGLIHRDIKPANLMVTERDGRYDVVKLLDFGLAQTIQDASSGRESGKAAISGTPLFMSPEQACGHDLDARSDIYSLGAVAYMLLCGRPPFAGPNPVDVLIAHARDEVTPPSEINRNVPADLEAVVLRCLAKRSGDRFPDVEHLEQALESCAAASHWTQPESALWWHEHPPIARARASDRRELSQSTSPYAWPRPNLEIFSR